MNKLRRSGSQVPFPPVDKADGHQKGTLPGNMMGYSDKGSAPPASGHVPGKIQGNMMAYHSSRDPLPKPTEGYGPAPLSEPTRSGFGGKQIPGQMTGYKGINPENPEWTRIASKKKGT